MAETTSLKVRTTGDKIKALLWALKQNGVSVGKNAGKKVMGAAAVDSVIDTYNSLVPPDWQVPDPSVLVIALQEEIPMILGPGTPLGFVIEFLGLNDDSTGDPDKDAELARQTTEDLINAVKQMNEIKKSGQAAEVGRGGGSGYNGNGSLKAKAMHDCNWEPMGRSQMQGLMYNAGIRMMSVDTAIEIASLLKLFESNPDFLRTALWRGRSGE